MLRCLITNIRMVYLSNHMSSCHPHPHSWVPQVGGCETTNITVLSKRKMPLKDESSSTSSVGGSGSSGGGQRPLTAPALKRSRSSCSSDDGPGGLEFQLQALERRLMNHTEQLIRPLEQTITSLDSRLSSVHRTLLRLDRSMQSSSSHLGSGDGGVLHSSDGNGNGYGYGYSNGYGHTKEENDLSDNGEGPNGHTGSSTATAGGKSDRSDSISDIFDGADSLWSLGKGRAQDTPRTTTSNGTSGGLATEGGQEGEPMISI